VHIKGAVMELNMLNCKFLFLGLGKVKSFSIHRLSENSAGAARLFVWEEWVQYIECRKSVFACFHFPTQAAHYQDAFNNPNSFFKFWKRMKSKDDKRHARLVFSANSSR
jgi:hypothetical protein